MRVAVTGASGYLGTMLVCELAGRGDVERVVAIDIAPPPTRVDGVVYVQASVLDDLSAIFHENRVSAVAHLVHVFEPRHDRDAVRRLNIGGLEAVLRASSKCGVSTILYLGSTTAYWPRVDNPPRLAEEAHLLVPEAFQYSWDKAEGERILQRWADAHPQSRVIRFRGPMVLGPNTDNYVGRILTKPMVVKIAGADPPIQFPHEDDVAPACIALLESAPSGAYNVAPDDTVRYSEVVAAAGKRAIALPFPILYALTWLIWNLRLRWLGEVPPIFLDFIRYSFVADDTKFREVPGTVPLKSTRQAVLDFSEGFSGPTRSGED